MADVVVPERKLELMHTEIEDGSCVTFVLNGEDHTLGNSLRYIIMKDPEVQFCGYSIPHPTENKINFRIQTTGTPAIDILRRGLNNLTSLCQHVLTTFEDSVDQFKIRHQVNGDVDMDQS
ncbi:DNA-directed RNA polymerases I and III subunit RPAC2-like [Saccoglossus kowalevskii]|uniref:DNA-directed RNA polymerase I subunit D n=1 Tax=Saccoglossus kowalevskii TaxID=10224 RepID=A0ABM0MK44_SACKO|nr:PREDICTED: DNA-directed RNA polymerases I and III subunit RPAC2-like [Saccoglossus kowalevskii]